MSNKIIINYKECIPCFHESLCLWKYKDHFLLLMKELSNGDDEMRYCDENGNILSDSPVIIAKPSDELTDTRCIRVLE